MRHPPVEDRAGLGGLVIHVGVEEIASEVGEVLNVLKGDHPGFGVEGIADLEFVEVQGERVALVEAAGRAVDPLPRHLGEEIRRALNGGSLHVVEDRSHTAEFFTAARSARARREQVAEAVNHGRSTQPWMLRRWCGPDRGTARSRG